MEIEGCTFEPKLNPRQSPLRNSTAKYVENYLYKPKPRVDRNRLDIEYEQQKRDCKFKPELTSKRAESRVKVYIKTGKEAKTTKSK